MVNLGSSLAIVSAYPVSKFLFHACFGLFCEIKGRVGVVSTWAV